MATSVDIPFSSTIRSKRTLDDTFAYLTDLEKNVGDNFPGIETIRPVAPATYEWTFKSIKYQGFDLSVRFATKVVTAPPHRITLEPSPGPYTSRLKGTWTLNPGHQGLHVQFDFLFQIEIALPSFLKTVLTPLAEREFTQLLKRYVNNVEKSLSK